MSYVMQDVIDIARQPLNDSSKTRYSDAVLLSYAISALLMLRNKRPDLFFGSFDSLPAMTNLTVSSNLPIDDEYAQPVADYVTARASSHDDDHVVSERAKLFFELFTSTGL